MTDSEMTPPPVMGTENQTPATPPPPPAAQPSPPPQPTVPGAEEAPKLQGNFPQNPVSPAGTENLTTPPPVSPQGRPPQLNSELTGNAFQNPPAENGMQPSSGQRFSLDQCREIFQNRSLLIAFCSIFVLGFLLGACFFSGGDQGTSSSQQSSGLTGVVPNPEPNVAKLKRCGLAERGEPCLIYLVNHSKYEQYAEKFFEEASRLTEVNLYSIKMDNLRYATTLIRPGQIAQIKVPAL